MAKAGDNRKAEHSEYQEPLRLYNGFYKGSMRDLGLRAQSMWFMGFRGSALNSQPPNPETPNPVSESIGGEHDVKLCCPGSVDPGPRSHEQGLQGVGFGV